jgi:hypothetical protein
VCHESSNKQQRNTGVWLSSEQAWVCGIQVALYCSLFYNSHEWFDHEKYYTLDVDLLCYHNQSNNVLFNAKLKMC